MKRIAHKFAPDKAGGSVAARAVEAIIVTGVIVLSSLVVIALALAAPFIFAITAIVAIATRNQPPRRWRSAGA